MSCLEKLEICSKPEIQNGFNSQSISEKFKKFNICSQICESMKGKVNAFHVFDDINGYNVLFITSDDKVFGFGSNQFGCCGLGHGFFVDEPEVIPELCYKGIRQFFSGSSFVLGLTNDIKVYGWGENDRGQLGRGYVSEANQFFKPAIISSLSELKIIQISCGPQHTLLLTADNVLFGWGQNSFGQVGCGKEKMVCKPTQLRAFRNMLVQSVHCTYYSSFALTADGQAYSWGFNERCDLGHDLDKNECVFEPKLIENLPNVISVCPSKQYTYFLTNDGLIYFCGQFKDDNNVDCFQKLPKLLRSETKFTSLHSIPNYQKRVAIATAVSALPDNSVYYLNFDEIHKSEFEDRFEFYAQRHQQTPETISNYNKYLYTQGEEPKDREYKRIKAIKEFENLELIDSESKSDKLKPFPIFSPISKELKERIEIYHVFDDINGYNVLFITSDDKVFGFGSNHFGCCGLGHNSVVNEPQLIPELCHKNIKQFFNGLSFVFALNSDNQLYGWGRNDHGLLLNQQAHSADSYLKPYMIPFDMNIVLISCGSAHCLALTNMGNFYAWGDNQTGQIGCGIESGQIISRPIMYDKYDSTAPIKAIYCSDQRSYALSMGGLVYSWGQNSNCCLGHELNENECIFEPKLVPNISSVISITYSNSNTYFLTNDGIIYFCGKYFDENLCESLQKMPKRLNSTTKFNSLHSLVSYQKGITIATAVSEDCVHCLEYNELKKTNYQTFYEFYSEVYNICFKTINLSDFSANRRTHYNNNHFNKKFKTISTLGSGGFGKVVKVEHRYNQRIYAVKIIQLSEELATKYLLREVQSLSKCGGDYAVQYFDSWIEDNNCLYIQMELCSHNLKDIIQQKRLFFKDKDQMTTIEYFISSQLLKELLECVRYLHESNPPIIHRDLKPANVLILENSKNKRFVKISDFGLATFDGALGGSQAEFVGTPKYAAPEVYGNDCNFTFSGSGAISHTQGIGTFGYRAREVCRGRHYTSKADVYSLGKIAKELFDFDIDSSNGILNNQLLATKLQGLHQITEKMTCQTSSDRPSCAQLLSKFNEWGLSASELENNILECYKQVKFDDQSFFIKYLDVKLICT